MTVDAEAIMLMNQTYNKPWHTKLSYFISLSQEKRDVDISRLSENSAFERELFKADYDATLLSFTVGGNVFDQTSVHLDVTASRFELVGDIYAPQAQSVQYQRNKTLIEIFAERDLKQGYTVGFDAYYGGDFYKNQGDDNRYYDQEYGGGLMLSKKFRFDDSHLRFDYIFSHRQIKVDSLEEGNIGNSFHNIIAGYSYQWNFDWYTDMTGRLSYYPNYDLNRYWDARYITSLATELGYRMWGNNIMSLRAERMWFGGHSNSNIFTLKLEHQFGTKKSKRRQRRYKMPNLLIK